MANDFVIPAIVAQRIALPPDVINLWKGAVWSIKQGQERFIKAFAATLDHLMPDWRTTWKTDPMFSLKLKDVEEAVREMARANGLSLRTWNRYVTSARKSLLCGVPFEFTQAMSLEDLKRIAQAENPELLAKQIRKERRTRTIVSLAENYATVLPNPHPTDHRADFLETAATRLKEYLRIVKEKYGEDGYKTIIEAIKE